MAYNTDDFDVWSRKAIIFPSSENSRLGYFILLHTELTNDIINLSIGTRWFSITKQEFEEFPSTLSVSNYSFNNALGENEFSLQKM